ncbi:family 20 glycosylhydrolase [Rapidithrix thailandica]|uniref:beta-N-acetylhexosaminidase n=1 Tax=Rapidithrix thailandica TaxID=413964 RepID=A0AAW9SAI8_9BACT
MKFFRTTISILGMVLLLWGCEQKQVKLLPVQIIPQPRSIDIQEAPPFLLDKDIQVFINDSSMLPAASLLQDILPVNSTLAWYNEEIPQTGFLLQLSPELDSLSREGYSLQVNEKQVGIRSAGPQGLFYAVESIRQLLPAQKEVPANTVLGLPAVRIQDAPRFAWRGMHLDVSRHFMPLDFVKKYIDYLALHKLNVFHWHLVDGIGWRIEIKSHPELTDWGAWRVVKEGKKPWQDFEIWKPGDERPKYGGYYTQEEIKEVLAYAKERFVTVVPEIELPGHSEVVFQCYPDLLCQDHKGKSLKNIGVYCASNPKSYTLLEEILDEVIELFPSEYIHIGGDEVSKSNWKACANCQKLMKKEGYTPHELQSHFVNHFDKYLKEKGRKLIGWHEILEGELSPSATIMYWGGEKGVADNLSMGHPTVLTTGSHFYFDHYQSLSKEEPKAFGGYAPLKKVYEYEPVPDGLDKSLKNNLLGVQANIWTEYVPNPQHAEYMVFPRMAALAEVAWQAEGTKNWERFQNKMEALLNHYQALGINYAPSAFRPDIQFALDRESKRLKVTLETELKADIYYTTDGSEPSPQSGTPYQAPFWLDASCTIKAIAVKNGKIINKPETKEAILHKAIGTEVELNNEGYGKYKAEGGYTLVDADFGGDKWGNGKWLGILNRDLEATLKLDTLSEIRQIKLSCIEETSAGVYFPAAIEVAVSQDGKSYQTVQAFKNERSLPIPKVPDIHTNTFELNFDPVACQYIRVKAQYQKVNNQGVFIFADELMVE